MIYLDHAATAFPRHPGVPEAMIEALEIAGSVGRGSHGGARGATAIVQSCRERLAHLFCVGDPARMVLFPSSTLALSTIISDLAAASTSSEQTLWIGPLEHNAVWRPAVRALGADRVRRLPADATGRIDVAALANLEGRGALGVIVQHASNVDGVVQPIAEIGAWASEHELTFIVDGAQAAGLVPVRLEAVPGLSAYTMAGHKYLGGPPGVGIVWLAAGYEPSPLWIGGNGVDSELPRIPDTGPARYESGTPNLPGIAALDRALAWFDDHPVAASFEQLNEVRRDWRDRLVEISGLELIGEGEDESPRSPVISVRIPGLDPAELGALLDAKVGARCRAGLHCAPLAHEHLGTLAEGGTTRIAPGPETTADERDGVLEVLAEIARAER